MNMDLKSDKTKKWIVFGFFMLLLVLATRFFMDYGISWDEPPERRSGIYSFCIIYKFFTGEALDVDLTKWKGDRYYGVGLQHILLLADYLAGYFSIHPFGSLPSWLLRHYLNCIFMLCGLFFMYKTAHLLLRDRLKALLPVILFLFMPRFVAESFYNIKDMGLLATTMAGGYFMTRYALYTTWQNALYLGIASAVACSTRLSSLQLFIGGLGICFFMDLLCRKKTSAKKILLQLFCLSSSFIFCITVLYPACWSSGPFSFFREALIYMCSHPWEGTIRFCGKDWASGTTPWYYLPVWIGITTPLSILFLLFTGSGVILLKFFRNPVQCFRKRTVLILLMYFMMFWAVLLLLPFLVKNVYNSWRQFYFLGYPMLLLASFGAIGVWNKVKQWKMGKGIFIGTVAVITVLHVSWMISQHPYQYMYFNILSTDPQNDFELDYWHVGRADALRKILDKNAGNNEVKYIAYDYTLSAALAMLGDEEQMRFKTVSRYGFYDYIVLMNDNGCLNPGSEDRYMMKPARKVISDEICWVKNSLWTKKVMVYRIIEFERVPGAKIKPVQY